MELDRAKRFDFRAARTWAACDLGIGGLGSNPTNPWCQRSCRPPPDLSARRRARRDRQQVRALRVRVALLAGFVSMMAKFQLGPMFMMLVAIVFSFAAYIAHRGQFEMESVRSATNTNC